MMSGHISFGDMKCTTCQDLSNEPIIIKIGSQSFEIHVLEETLMQSGHSEKTDHNALQTQRTP